MVISFVQTKGGTGKSTLAVGTTFSPTLHSRFSKIALVELDPQGTLKNWWQAREEEGRSTDKVSFHHISSTQKEVIQESLKTIEAHNDLLVLDVPGESIGKLHTKFACAISDLVIIPMRTSTNDESAFSDNLLPVIKEILRSYPERKDSFKILPSFTNAQTSKEKVHDYFNDILPNYVNCLDAVYPFRALYENFNREGMTLFDYKEAVKNNQRLHAQAQKAFEDMEEIGKKIIQILEKQNGRT